MGLFDTITWHSSYPWTTVLAERRWRQSVVIVASNTHMVVGCLPRALRIARGWDGGQRFITFLYRVRHHMERAADYNYLMALCKHEIPKSEADDLLVGDLWRMWGMSEWNCVPSTHKRNVKFITRELRSRGITLRPDSDFIVTLPPGSFLGRRHVILTLKRMNGPMRSVAKE